LLPPVPTTLIAISMPTVSLGEKAVAGSKKPDKNGPVGKKYPG
jgi:hypothetical protein